MEKRNFGIISVFLIALFLSSGAFGAENQDINELIKTVEKKIQKTADILAIRNLMSNGRYGMTPTGSRNRDSSDGSPGEGPAGIPGVSRPFSSKEKDYIQCFGQNDGYAYGDWISRMTQKMSSGQGRGPAGAPEGQGTPPGDMPGAPPSGGPSAQGGSPMGGPGGRGAGAPSAPGSGTSLDFHMLTSYVIEVAEDGKTAKGIWYSPGVLSEPSGATGEHMSAWIYEMYASDFVKENGTWREFHRTLSTDFMTAPSKSWTGDYDTSKGVDEVARIGGILDRTKTGEYKSDTPDDRQSTGQGAPGVQGGRGGAPGGPGGGMASFKDLQVVAYQSWTPSTMPQYKPKPPVPYETFKETFSYCPPVPEDILKEIMSE